MPGYQKPMLGRQLNRAHPLSKGLVGAWVMNEGSGDRVNDLSGNGNHGTITGTGWVAGDKGPAFGGNRTGYITLPNLGVSGSTPRTVVMKFYLLNTDSSDDALVCWGTDTADGNNFTIYSNLNGAGQIYLYTKGRDKYTASNVFSANKWHSAALSYNGGNIEDADSIEMYVDGNSVNFSDVGANTGVLDTGDTNYFIEHWAFDAADDLRGYMEHVYIYDRVLAPAEISWLHREPYAMFEPSYPIWLQAAVAAVSSQNTHAWRLGEQSGMGLRVPI
ncbi:MAG: LamG-like jellyroll fold domain-containing protein [Candidatus Thorarchaeota archaeon]|jgi:hypothetical protein